MREEKSSNILFMNSAKEVRRFWREIHELRAASPQMAYAIFNPFLADIIPHSFDECKLMIDKT